MKKALSVLLAIIMIFTALSVLCSCDTQDDQAEPQETTQTTPQEEDTTDLNYKPGGGTYNPSYKPEDKGSEGLKYTFHEDSVSYSVSRGDCTDTDIVIPKTYNGLPVTFVDIAAFQGCSNLKSVVLPDSITSISVYAFYGCSSLTNIVIPDSVTGIGDNAFTGCKELIEKENGVYYVDKWVIGCDTNVTSVNLRTDTKGIGNHAFSRCMDLTSIVIPDSVTHIGYSSFLGCSNLTSIVIPDSVIDIDERAFEECFGIIEEENGVYYVDKWAIDCNEEVISVDLRTDTKGIANYTFSECRYLANIIIPNSVTRIGRRAFFVCTGLESIILPEGVISIGSYAFCSCLSLTSIVIPDSITSIGSYAFKSCGNLMSIEIPHSVTSIGMAAFKGCISLTSITVDAENPIYHSDGNCLIETATKTMIGGSENSVIPTDGSVTRIGDYAFSICCNPTSIVIPDGVTSIGNYAFSDCSNLIGIVIPSSVTSIGCSVFYNCIELMSINFNGTQEQWNAISKNNDWDYHSIVSTICCTDGNISK